MKKIPILRTIRGSRLHNTHTSTSDHDLLSVYMWPREWYLSTRSLAKKRSSHYQNVSNENPEIIHDIEEHELIKFINILTTGNIGYLEHLFSEYYVYRDPFFEQLVRCRGLFLSQRGMGAVIGQCNRDLAVATKYDKVDKRVRYKKLANAMLNLYKGFTIYQHGNCETTLADDSEMRRMILRIKSMDHDTDPWKWEDALDFVSNGIEEFAMYKRTLAQEGFPEEANFDAINAMLFQFLSKPLKEEVYV